MFGQGFGEGDNVAAARSRGGIVANCKLEPKADEMLHLVIADIGAGTDAMAGKDAKARPALGLVKVAEAVNQYGSHFGHPGFQPIRNVH